MESTGLDKRGFHLIGTSLGGAIAAIYSARFPEGVEKLTLSCPASKRFIYCIFLGQGQ